MNTVGAIEDSVNLARRERALLPKEGPTSLSHFEEMLDEVKGPFSEGKRNRWLGYIQGALVAHGCASLEDVKRINRNHAA